MSQIMPIKLQPILKKYIWGKEEWMLSDLHEGVGDSQMLIKIITAEDHLSIQVHPGNEYAWENEHSLGKTEMWYVLACEPDAYLYYGLKHKITTDEFIKRIKNDSILEVCQKIQVKKGDVFYIPAGMIHAIGKGVTVAEVQQNSNITYRVYDYHRRDEKQNFRPLHIKQAEEVAGFTPPLQGHRPMGTRKEENGNYKTLLVHCPYFQVKRIEVEIQWKKESTKAQQSLLILEGEGLLNCRNMTMELKKGDSIYIPKEAGEYEVCGKVKFLLSEAS
ncbi:MAG: class I mannose-6-phosphate isomerase [Lachnospiraceae bacterium]|nr:class I mannose-6-phosphate isomerase [Lachnospiraceae bacterium]